MIPFFLADAAATATQTAAPVAQGMSPMLTFFCGVILLVLFAWYIMCESDRAKRIVGTVLTIGLVAFCFQMVWPPFDQRDANGEPITRDANGKEVPRGKITLGLDLRGGTAFLIQLMPASTEGEGRKITTQAVEQAIEAIRNRIDKMGVSEPILTPQGEDRILVQIPGLRAESIADAREQLQKVAKLEFRLVHPHSYAILQGTEQLPADFIIAKERIERGGKKTPETGGGEIVVHRVPDLKGDQVERAGASFGAKGYEVVLGFSKQGGTDFARLTRENVGNQFAIMLDGEVISAPRINEEIPNGSAVISGSFTESDARNLSSALENPLQNPVEIIQESSVSSTLGQDSISNGIKAGVGGLALVLVFVLFYYRFAGLVAIIGLVANIVVLFGVMAAFGFVLTLPGIAGIILTIGLAVDANVLIYERLREEMEAGKSISVALNSAYDKAFTVIFDANATTLITAAILFWKASGPVRGFSVALIIGVIASVFTAMIVTRVIFAWALHWGIFRKITMLHLIPTGKSFNFLGRRRLWISISVAIIVISSTVFGMRGAKNFGIDFKGGDVLVLSMEHSVDEGKVRDALEPLKLGETIIQKETSGAEKREFISVRSPGETSAKILAHLQQVMPEAGFKQSQQEHVGPTAGRELAKSSLIAFGLAMLGILVYVTLRFEFSFAIGAIVALLHDVILTVGVFALFGRELTLIMVGAILTIAGYSINDTIVVFDRIREGLRAGRRGSVQDIMNASINETLSRTLLTSGCTALSVTALYLFGGPVLHDFAFAILIGIIVGTYSSIFIASPVVLWWSGHKGQSLRNEMDRTGGAGVGTSGPTQPTQPTLSA